ncbi:MAG: hypothetical protein FD120_2750 [Gammaproteobacteria bacterium]|nr:MAG: hypothetical protein FD172_3595 [Methylocystaceae bacterium]TND00685.1 MAG: hypothetical protein FD120_2750 [Gammaproteobacteria bacterium]
MKRLGLVDRRSDRFGGDASAAGLHAQTWTKIAAHDDIANLALQRLVSWTRA